MLIKCLIFVQIMYWYFFSWSLWSHLFVSLLTFIVIVIQYFCRWLKAVPMVKIMMAWSSLSLYVNIIENFSDSTHKHVITRLFSFFPFFLWLELDRSCWIWELENWNNWIKKKRRILHKQKSSNTWNSRHLAFPIFVGFEEVLLWNFLGIWGSPVR